MIKTAVIGSSGYSGMELLRLLNQREDISIEHVIANSTSGKLVSELNPFFSGELDLKIEKYQPEILDTLTSSIDVVFISLPSGESMKIVPEILRAGVKVIDLGGDFRLKDPASYKKYYKFEHLFPGLLAKAVYGLPEIYKDSISNTNLVSNPGCYPTSIILPIIPALKNGIISGENIVINSLSGVSGAGKKETLEYSYTEVNENIRAYKILEHQHIPEIKQILEDQFPGDPFNKEVRFSFIPHLVPINRGIYTTILADLNISLNENDIYNLFEEFYSDSSFIRIKKNVPQIKNVVNTNYCDIHPVLDTQNNKLILISVIDNLLKGAAGQALQNMNIMFGLDETCGLIRKEKKHV